MTAQKRKRRRLNPRFVLLCLAVLLAAAGICRLALRADRGLPGEGVPVPDYVEADLLPENQWSRPGTPLVKDCVSASAHFIARLEGEVVQCIPLTEIAYASNDRNGDTVAIEVCHPDETGEFSAVTYDRLVELTAWLCRTFDLDPETEVIRHYDVSGKECPRYYVENPEAWDTLRADVAAALAAEKG